MLKLIRGKNIQLISPMFTLFYAELCGGASLTGSQHAEVNRVVVMDRWV